MMTLLITGGAGFIGSNFILQQRAKNNYRIVNLDKLTYAGNLANLECLRNDNNHIFIHGDINDRELVRKLLNEYKPDAVIHFAAESHVDRSIIGPDAFIQTNIVGTFNLLEEVRSYWNCLNNEFKGNFRFHHVSTDEVYGSLEPDAPSFKETNPYTPNSPYSASKASSDHLVRSYNHTYNLPTLITNCSNNYGPLQFPEKLIPLMIINAINCKSLPVYGDGKNIRDWLYVTDHTEAINLVLKKGKIGETYNIGGGCEKTNVEIVETICNILDSIFPDSKVGNHSSLIKFVKDRPGHDRRYAIDSSKITNDLGWAPKETFETGIMKTIQWYIDNMDWVESVQTGSYREWINMNYEKRY